jgi:NADPH-dependent curcumin reductase
MEDDVNRAWRVARLPQPGEDISVELFRLEEESVPAPADGEFLVRTICLAPGPAQRGYLLRASRSASLDAVRVGDVMRGRGVGQIVRSRHPGYRAGDLVVASLGWQDYSIQRDRGTDFVFSTRKLPDPVRPLSTALGILGQAGATAYFGLLEVGAMKPADAVLVSAAAGGVGSVAGQIAKICGARQVVGIAGGAEKCRWLTSDLGYDAAIDYRAEDVGQRLAELFPDGIDLFFDNVGGDILNQGLGRLALGARVVICGFISTDFKPGPQPGPGNYKHLLYKRAEMKGFVFFDYWDRYAEAEAQLSAWFRQGLLVNCEDVDQGLEKMPGSLASLFTGGNRGIKICRVAADPDAPASSDAFAGKR